MADAGSIGDIIKGSPFATALVTGGVAAAIYIFKRHDDRKWISWATRVGTLAFFVAAGVAWFFEHRAQPTAAPPPATSTPPAAASPPPVDSSASAALQPAAPAGRPTTRKMPSPAPEPRDEPTATEHGINVKGNGNKLYENQAGQDINVRGDDNDLRRNKANVEPSTQAPPSESPLGGRLDGVLVYGNVDERPGARLTIEGSENHVAGNSVGIPFDQLPPEMQDAIRRRQPLPSWHVPEGPPKQPKKPPIPAGP